jgi:uncharacterized repeat protein (TIGR03803 family)
MPRCASTLIGRLTATFATFVLLAAASLSAQTFTVLYNFTGGSDGGDPISGLAIDTSGNLYGAAFTGGVGYGTTFELSPGASGWTFDTLYSFQGSPVSDGAGPSGILLLPNGALYGTTQGGGGGCVRGVSMYAGCGVVYELAPPPTRSEHVLYQFANLPNGVTPYGLGPLTLHSGSLYGTTFLGGTNGNCIYDYQCGLTFKLTPSSGTWNETIAWEFGGTNDGDELASNVIFDKDGNMYGTTLAGGDTKGCHVQGHQGCGIIYELSPSGAAWTESILYNFTGKNDGGAPYGGLIFDKDGNLYGTTSYGGSRTGGTIYRLSHSASGWTYKLLYSFAGAVSEGDGQCTDCPGSYASMIMDSAGNLYGTTIEDGAFGLGMAFELAKSSGGYTFTDLHDFTGGADGGLVWAGLVRDSSGNLYGMASTGGANEAGVVYEITP